jgi:hypothetical protein
MSGGPDGQFSFGAKIGSGTAASPFSGTADYYRVGNFVYVVATITRATSFANAFTATGIVAPSSLWPTSNESGPATTFYGSTAQYQFRQRTTGELEVRQTAANTLNMELKMWYRLG